MVSTFTTARNLEKPAAGDQIGTWGTASINPDLDVLDAGAGQTATISGAAGSVVLAAGQFRCAQITFNSTLLASITATFPTSFTGPYTIYNACTGSSAFTITLTTTAAGGQVICPPPGERVDIWNDGASLNFRNLERVGTLVDTMLSSMPNWVDGCSPQKPYLNCDGSAVSSAVYPTLISQGISTLPDFKGRYRATLNQGTGRIQSSVGGVDGDTRSASGGSQATLISSQHLPSTALNEPSSGHRHVIPYYVGQGLSHAGAGTDTPWDAILNANSCSATTGITFGTSVPTAFPLLPPTAIAGITMIRAG